MLKVLLVLLLSNASFALECKPSIYKFRGEALCFSSLHKTYLTQNCSDDKCDALEMLKNSGSVDRKALPQADSRHPGAKTCLALGGSTTVVSSDKTTDQICLCVGKDHSGLSCSTLGLR